MESRKHVFADAIPRLIQISSGENFSFHYSAECFRPLSIYLMETFILQLTFYNKLARKEMQRIQLQYIWECQHDFLNTSRV